jgi:hypothetical protein
MMENIQVVEAVSVGVAASAMIVLGRAKGMLEHKRPGRCAACGRLLKQGRRCNHCE